MHIVGYKMVFVGGLQRSGTSILFKCLCDHPKISGFRDTGVPEDEGQFLQTVYPPGRHYGGPGVFGFHPDAHLTEQSHLATAENAAIVFQQWSLHWDMSRPVLVEKSPPNLIWTRFLQALFPEALFVMMLRHPIPVSYSTRKWRPQKDLPWLLQHWVHCHELFYADKGALGDRLLIVRYEDFVSDPNSSLNELFRFIGVEPTGPRREIETGRNKVYLDQWAREPGDFRQGIVRQFGPAVERFGYRLAP